MKKILKKLCFLPFAVSISALILYLVYTIQIKLNNKIAVTDALTSRLKMYLIIALVSLFIGLLIILIKKIYNLFKTDTKVKKVKKEKMKKEKVKKEKKIKSKKEEIMDENILKVKLTNPKLNGDVIVGKLEDTMQDVEVYIDDKKEYNFRLEAVACPECGGLISKDAAICPHCGILFDDEVLRFLSKKDKTKVKVKTKKNKKIIIVNVLLIILFIILILLLTNVIINKGKENTNNIKPVVINDQA